MRARHRHFNARDVGAALCLDARFISGLSDGNAVTTWSDRTRNAADAVQNTAANQPQYKTAIQGGQPVVRFDGTDDFYPMTSTSLASVVNDTPYAAIIATTRDRTPTGGRSQHMIFVAGNSNNASLGKFILRTKDYGGNRFQSAGRRLEADSQSQANSSPSDESWHVLASDQNFSNNANRIRVDYSVRATATYSSGGGNTSALNSSNVEIGRANNDINNSASIDLGQLVVLNTATTDALVKRLHHHAAFSFKISCN